MKMPAVLDVTAGIIFSAKPTLHVHHFVLRSNGSDPDVDINPPSVHALAQVLSSDQQSKTVKLKVHFRQDRVLLLPLERTGTSTGPSVCRKWPIHGHSRPAVQARARFLCDHDRVRRHDLDNSDARLD
ncbi:hypothetical protein A4X09_0g7621 [Tilletia walkeri]|uniref:Uncharacterized protein n=1 Tax=Tilletia walkeri TaxID=117179 RepID=A0A8X7N1T7_9BASI|nr:hypothetical protein A4X09_0g7621 [Tilletia walkeri]